MLSDKKFNKLVLNIEKLLESKKSVFGEDVTVDETSMYKVGDYKSEGRSHTVYPVVCIHGPYYAELRVIIDEDKLRRMMEGDFGRELYEIIVDEVRNFDAYDSTTEGYAYAEHDEDFRTMSEEEITLEDVRYFEEIVRSIKLYDE